jgi:hypothetical protein
MPKVDAIRCAVHHLEERLEKGAFQIVDHWEGDDLAIGVANSGDAQRLVYIATSNHSQHLYDCFLERAPTPQSGVPYEDCGKFGAVSLDELAQLVSSHLGIGNEPEIS